MGNITCGYRENKMPPSPRLNDPPKEEGSFVGWAAEGIANNVKLPELPAMPSVPLLPKVPFFGGSNEDDGTATGADIGLLNLGDNDDGEEIRDLSKLVDLDKLRVAFVTYAGPDKRMDKDEYHLFMKRLKMPVRIASRLWTQLDVDKNGIVTADEFTDVMATLTSARAWARYCPTCEFDNGCDYCQSAEILDCDRCTRDQWCPKHWSEHPDSGDVPEK